MRVRAASLRPATLDRSARTVEAIVSTFADVERPGFIERLDPAGADLSRLIGGPVLDAHRRESTRDQLGVIEEARIAPEGLLARLRFRQGAAGDAVLGDIADGTLRGLSIGFAVARFRETTEGGRRVRLAVEWTPLEVSLVPVPADAGAHFRHLPNGGPMPESAETTDPAEAEVIVSPPETATGAERAAVNARIRSIAATAGLGRDWADARIDAGDGVEAARAAAFDAMAARQAATRTRTARAEVGIDHADPAAIAARAGEALYARTAPGHTLSEPARAYAGLTMPELARDCLRRAGAVPVGLSAQSVITRALHTTSDFPLILGDAVNRTLRAAYDAAPSGVRQLARQTTARDFRAKHRIQLGEAPTLEKVAEGGEFTAGTLAEAEETYRAETFGRIVSISRQALINDDLGAFADLSRRLGIAARQFENGFLTTLLAGNPVMSDGEAVFSAAHGNTEAAGADLEASLATARLRMRQRTGLSGDLVAVTPRFVLVPPELETAMEKQLTAIQARATADVNPFAGLTLLVEPRLATADTWYVVADPASIDGLEYCFLEGAEGPQIETRNGFEVDGVQIRVRLDFGAGWVDHRGWQRITA